MKKFFIILIIILVIAISAITYLYYQNNTNAKSISEFNKVYESYLDQEVYGTDVISLINRAIDSNEKNMVSKDNDGKYIDNNSNSVIITIKFIGTDEKEYIYSMETIASQGSTEFVKHYGAITFKCTSIEYHDTKMVKSLYFEQQV